MGEQVIGVACGAWRGALHEPGVRPWKTSGGARAHLCANTRQENGNVRHLLHRNGVQRRKPGATKPGTHKTHTHPHTRKLSSHETTWTNWKT